MRILARAGITIAATGLFFLVRPDALDYALNQVRVAYRRDIASPQLIGDYLRNNKIRKLQIGVGHNLHAGWLNTDTDVSAH